MIALAALSGGLPPEADMGRRAGHAGSV